MTMGVDSHLSPSYPHSLKKAMKKISIPWPVLAVLGVLNIASGIRKGFDILSIAALGLIAFSLSAEFYLKKVKK